MNFGLVLTGKGCCTMTNKRSASSTAETLAVFLLFVSSGETELSGFVVSDFSVFHPLPEINCK